MPIPTPKDDETQDEFISRCMSEMKDEFPDQKVRLGVCYSAWEKTKEGKQMAMIELRNAIPRHKTAVSDKPWDGPANEARLKLDQDYDYYSKAFAWYDPDGDKSKKSTYKFIHHEVDSDGNIGAANIKACQTGIAILNGARGGTNIPEKDKEGVWQHLAGHIRDADLEPAELKSTARLIKHQREVRSYPLAEIRISGRGDKIIGHAAVFNKLSEDLGGFKEMVAPGAFLESIENDDIRALFNHDPNYVLGRTTSGTLVMREDEKGLAVEIEPPDTQWARDLKESIRRGDITQMSFAFVAEDEDWDNESKVRTLRKVRLYDVSIVTYPAYPQTSIKLRSLLEQIGEDRAIEILQKNVSAAEGAKQKTVDYQRTRDGEVADGTLSRLEYLKRKLNLKKLI